MTAPSLSGRKFGRLEVLYKIGSATDKSGTVWRCRCDCGAYCKVRYKSLTSGSTKSCGCLLRDYRKWQEGGEGGAMEHLRETDEPAPDPTYEEALQAVKALHERFGEPMIRAALREIAHLKRVEARIKVATDELLETYKKPRVKLFSPLDIASRWQIKPSARPRRKDKTSEV